MFTQAAQRFKPGASVQAHLLLAAVLWSFIGVYLLIRGVLLYGDGAYWPPLVALAAGALKAYFMLIPSARKNIVRILALQENTCLGAVYSFKMWALVVVMMVAGRVLRGFGLPEFWVALIYLAVGLSLLLASGLFWRQWSRRRPA
ncbi:hypothetical protein [Desulfurivibrio dismutans]|uniref:hypothetical protein n=1 Tax=Desulfurivibrio dismutans TaxID=1398908 RepID=UPI0023DB6C41|nr:hypothetical protein [Desulfurivibrio alkaliphilus]MDF1615154.1 hypothetical protein [Desulfurivibrio alkaliphilus]